MNEKFDFEKGRDSKNRLNNHFYSKQTIDRLNAFVDAVLAIVATIMVLELKLPETGAHDWESLRPTVIGVFIFLISFIIVVNQYLTNLRVMNVIKKIHPTGVILMFLWIAILALLPFFTLWMVDDSKNRFAVLGYGIIYVGASLLHQALELNVVRSNFNPEEMDTPENNALAKLYNFAFNNQTKALVVLSIILLVVATIWPSWGFWLFILVPIFVFIDTVFDGELKDKISEEKNKVEDFTGEKLESVMDNHGHIDRQSINQQKKLRRNLYWNKLTPEQREAAEKNFEYWSKLTPDQKKEEIKKRKEQRTNKKQLR